MPAGNVTSSLPSLETTVPPALSIVAVTGLPTLVPLAAGVYVGWNDEPPSSTPTSAGDTASSSACGRSGLPGPSIADEESYAVLVGRSVVAPSTRSVLAESIAVSALAAGNRASSSACGRSGLAGPSIADKESCDVLVGRLVVVPGTKSLLAEPIAASALLPALLPHPPVRNEAVRKERDTGRAILASTTIAHLLDTAWSHAVQSKHLQVARREKLSAMTFNYDSPTSPWVTEQIKVFVACRTIGSGRQEVAWSRIRTEARYPGRENPRAPLARGNSARFAGDAAMGIAYPWPHFWGRCSVTTRGWAGRRSRPRRGRTCPKARPAAVGARRCGAGLRWGFRGGPESCVSLLAL